MQSKSYKMTSNLDQEQTIIQCPQCQTKFAVDSRLIAENDAPRFHCSRCDHVFAHEARSTEAAPASPRATLHEPQTAAFSIDASVSSSPAAAIGAPAFSEPESWSRPAARIERPARPFEVPRGTHSIMAEEPATVPVPEPTSYSQMGFDFSQAAVAKPAASTSAFTFGEPLVTTPTAAEQPQAARQRQPIAASLDIASPSGTWNSLVFAAAPLVFFLTAMLGFSYYLRGNTGSAETLYASLSSTAPQIPPATLRIETPKFKHVVLDSGESVYLVSGSLVNGSNETLKNIQLEGIAFNNEGEFVARTNVDIAATLGKTRLRSLTLEMIRNLQSGQLKSKFELKPGQREDFTFALLEGDASKAQYFSTRVHSVNFH